MLLRPAGKFSLELDDLRSAQEQYLVQEPPAPSARLTTIRTSNFGTGPDEESDTTFGP